MSKTLAPLYTSSNQEPVDVEMLSNNLFAINDYHEGMRMFCKLVIQESNTFEETAIARVILAALDATTKRVDALLPSSS